MLFPTLVFILIFAVPLLGFYFYIAFRDKKKNQLVGIAVIVVLFIFASVIAYFVNRNK